jgi:Vitamin K-dependent gamma-carboxylase
MTENPPTLPTLIHLRKAVHKGALTFLDRVSDHRYGLYGLSALRIGYGLILISILLSNYAERRLLWGPESAWTYNIFRDSEQHTGAVSLYQVSSSAVWSELLYHLMILLAVLFVLGWRTRWITPALLAAVWSWHERNPVVLDGGDNLMLLVLIYLCFAQLSARWALDSRRVARRQIAGYEVMHQKRLRWKVATVVHNSAVLAVLLQVCIVYMASGLFKVQGQRWQEGTVLYYVLQIKEYQTWPDLSRFVYTNSIAIVLFAYLTVFLEVAFPFLMLHRVSRRISLLAITGMHIGIGVLMGLSSFSLIMITTGLLFIRDATYGRVLFLTVAIRKRLAGTPATVRDLSVASTLIAEASCAGSVGSSPVRPVQVVDQTLGELGDQRVRQVAAVASSSSSRPGQSWEDGGVAGSSEHGADGVGTR